MARKDQSQSLGTSLAQAPSKPKPVVQPGVTMQPVAVPPGNAVPPLLPADFTQALSGLQGAGVPPLIAAALDTQNTTPTPVDTQNPAPLVPMLTAAQPAPLNVPAPAQPAPQAVPATVPADSGEAPPAPAALVQGQPSPFYMPHYQSLPPPSPLVPPLPVPVRDAGAEHQRVEDTERTAMLIPALATLFGGGGPVTSAAPGLVAEAIAGARAGNQSTWDKQLQAYEIGQGSQNEAVHRQLEARAQEVQNILQSNQQESERAHLASQQAMWMGNQARLQQNAAVRAAHMGNTDAKGLMATLSQMDTGSQVDAWNDPEFAARAAQLGVPRQIFTSAATPIRQQNADTASRNTDIAAGKATTAATQGGQKIAETGRHNKVTEGIGKKNADSNATRTGAYVKDVQSKIAQRKQLEDNFNKSYQLRIQQYNDVAANRSLSDEQKLAKLQSQLSDAHANAELLRNPTAAITKKESEDPQLKALRGVQIDRQAAHAKFLQQAVTTLQQAIAARKTRSTTTPSKSGTPTGANVDPGVADWLRRGAALGAPTGG